jgi:hypothetical protein
MPVLNRSCWNSDLASRQEWPSGATFSTDRPSSVSASVSLSLSLDRVTAGGVSRESSGPTGNPNSISVAPSWNLTQTNTHLNLIDCHALDSIHRTLAQQAVHRLLCVLEPATSCADCALSEEISLAPNGAGKP